MLVGTEIVHASIFSLGRNEHKMPFSVVAMPSLSNCPAVPFRYNVCKSKRKMEVKTETDLISTIVLTIEFGKNDSKISSLLPFCVLDSIRPDSTMFHVDDF